MTGRSLFAKRALILAALAIASVVLSMLLMHTGWLPRVYARLRARPHFCVIYSNDTRGELEPCRCSEDTGGLARRASLISQICAEGAPALIVDSGDIVGREQKLVPMLDAMQIMGYTDIGLGGLDGLFEDELMVMAQERGIRLHSWPIDAADKETAAVIPVGRLDVGIIGIGSDHLPLPSNVSAELAKRAVASIEKQADIIVLLSQLGQRADEVMAEALARSRRPVVMIGNRSWKDLDEGRQVGNVLIAPTGHLGRRIGRVDITVFAGEVHIKARTLPVVSAVDENAQVLSIVERYYEGERKKAGQMMRKADSERLFERPKKCAECHLSEVTQWRTTPHSQALNTLIEENRVVPECLECHSEVYRREKRLARSGEEDGIQCASCHGSGLGHTGKESPTAIEQPRGQAICVGCHTSERDTDFDSGRDLELVRHNK